MNYNSYNPIRNGLYNGDAGLVEKIRDLDKDTNNTSNKVGDLQKKTDAFVTPEMYNAVGDGIADDTTKLEDMLKSTGNKIKLGRNKTYKVTRKLQISKSFTEIDLNGSTIVIDTSTVPTQVTDNKLFYVAPPSVDVNAKKTNVTSVGVYYKFGSSPEKIAGKFTVGDVSKLSVGDCVVIDYQTAATNTHTLTDLKPTVATYAKILEIDVTNKIVYTDYYTELDFRGLPPVAGSGYMAVVTPIQKVKIKNGTLKSVTPNSANKKDCAIRAEYVDGFTLEDITLVDFNDMAIQPRWIRNITVRNIESDVQRGDKQLSYVVQCLNLYNGVLENITGTSNLAVLDFSYGSSYLHVKNVQSRTNNGAWGSIQLHGECEHDIMFENCSGFFSFANNTGEFPGYSYNITLENCKGSTYINGCDNLQINSSNLIITSTDYSNLRIYGVYINDSRIQLTKSVLYKASNRGGAVSPYLRFSNCDITPYYDKVTTGLYKFILIQFDEVSFRGCRIKNKTASIGAYLVLDSIKNLRYTDNEVEGLLCSVRVNDGGTATPFTFSNYIISDNIVTVTDDNCATKLSTTSLDALIQFSNVNNLTGKVTIKGNEVFFKKTHARPWKFIDFANITSASLLNFRIDRNRIESDTSGEVISYIPHNTGYKISYSGNIINPDIVSESGDYRLSNLYTVIPTSGTWEIRKRIENKTPTVSQPKSWICTVSGTPGTWVSEGNL